MAEHGDLDLGALREHLAASRRRGLPFEWAWRDACAALLVEPDQASGRVLAATRSAWADAYERLPARAHHQAAGNLALVLDDSAHAQFGRSGLLA